MNLEVERFKGELKFLRERVKDLEIELAWTNERFKDLHQQKETTWEEKTVEQDKFF